TRSDQDLRRERGQFGRVSAKVVGICCGPASVDPAERLGCFQIKCRFVSRWRLHWKLGWLRTPEDAIDIPARPPKQIDQVERVRNQAAFGDHEPIRRDGRQFVLASQPDNSLAMDDVESVRHHDEAATWLACEGSYRAFNLACVVNGT